MHNDVMFVNEDGSRERREFGYFAQGSLNAEQYENYVLSELAKAYPNRLFVYAGKAVDSTTFTVTKYLWREVVPGQPKQRVTGRYVNVVSKNTTT